MQSENKLLINPCPISYDYSCRHHIYHDQTTRSKEFCKYLGLYKDKSVSRVGEVLAVVNASYTRDNDIIITKHHPLGWRGGHLHKPTKAERDRILGIIQETETDKYDLTRGEWRYYIVEKFVACDFKKTSKYGIQGHRYFKLDGDDGVVPECFKDKSPSLAEIAAALSKKTWE